MDKIIRKIDGYSLELSRKLILGGQLVAFPTETVYGLGANAFIDEAIMNIYSAKKRPLDNPLIVHVHKDYDISDLVYDNEIAKIIRKNFTPGPITLVYKAKTAVSNLVSCGLDTLAIRVPSSEEAQKFLSYVDLPIAAPSANISKHTSPVTAEHVYEDFGENIPLILDGGRCEGGIESTVVDVTGQVPVILRKGLITKEDIAKVVGVCEYAESTSELNARSPGTKYRHYTPKTQTAIFKQSEIVEAIKLYESFVEKGLTPYFMCDSFVCKKLENKNCLDLGSNGKEMANRLYFLLHQGEKVADLIIAIEITQIDELCLSVNNRFLKAFGS